MLLPPHVHLSLCIAYQGHPHSRAHTRHTQGTTELCASCVPIQPSPRLDSLHSATPQSISLTAYFFWATRRPPRQHHSSSLPASTRTHKYTIKDGHQCPVHPHSPVLARTGWQAPLWGPRAAPPSGLYTQSCREGSRARGERQQTWPVGREGACSRVTACRSQMGRRGAQQVWPAGRGAHATGWPGHHMLSAVSPVETHSC